MSIMKECILKYKNNEKNTITKTANLFVLKTHIRIVDINIDISAILENPYRDTPVTPIIKKIIIKIFSFVRNLYSKTKSAKKTITMRK